MTFQDYHGGSDYNTAIDFIKQKFLSQNERHGNIETFGNNNFQIFAFTFKVTCALESEDIRTIFDRCE